MSRECCPKCGWVLDFGACGCVKGEPTFPTVQSDDLLDAAKAVLKWADDLKPFAEDGTEVVPVFERLRKAIAARA